MRAIFFASVLLVAAAACSSDRAKGGPPATSVDGLVGKLKQAGLSVDDLKPVEVAKLGGGKCKAGGVGGVEMTVCEYDDASRAKKFEGEGLAMVGDSTGSALAEGKLLLVVADRQGVDKDGKRINAITKALRGK